MAGAWGLAPKFRPFTQITAYFVCATAGVTARRATASRHVIKLTAAMITAPPKITQASTASSKKTAPSSR